MSKKRKKKVTKKTESKESAMDECPACGTINLKDEVCHNCNYGQKPKISD